MTIYQRMMALFESIGVTGYLNTAELTTGQAPSLPDVYAAYNVLSDGDAVNADDDELIHSWRVMVDVHGRGDISATVDALRTALKSGGFYVQHAQHLDGMYGSRYIYHRRVYAVYYEHVDAAEEETDG